MKKSRFTLTKMDEQYICKYTLESSDVVDTKAFDTALSGKIPQMLPCSLEENDGEREFVYKIEDKILLTEYLKKEINKQQMLTILCNILSALEKFGQNMISLSYAAKDIQYIFIDAKTLEIYLLVAAVNKEVSDLNEVRNLVKDIISSACYFEMDKDNYVAKLITFANKQATFSIIETKEYVHAMLNDMGINPEANKIDTGSQQSGRVSRVAVMQNNAKMNQSVRPQMQMGPDGRPIPPMQGRPMPPQGAPMPMQMGPDGRPIPPMQGRPMSPQGAPMPMQMGPDGRPIPPMQGRPMPPQQAEAPKTPISEAPQQAEAPKTPIPETPQQAEVSEAPQPMPYLLRIRNNEKIYIDKTEFTIGKSATKADYTIEDNTAVSRLHCVITRKNGVSYIKDNNSTNGTFVNGKDISGEENVFLTNKAKLSLGDEEFIYFVR